MAVNEEVVIVKIKKNRGWGGVERIRYGGGGVRVDVKEEFKIL